MGGIASRYHVSLRLLTDANPRVRGRALRSGPADHRANRRRAVHLGGATRGRSGGPGGQQRLRLPPRASRRDALWPGRRIRCDVSQLRKWNVLGQTEGIRAGQRLRIAPPGQPPGSRPDDAQGQQRGRPNDGLASTLCAGGKRSGAWRDSMASRSRPSEKRTGCRSATRSGPAPRSRSPASASPARWSAAACSP